MTEYWTKAPERRQPELSFLPKTSGRDYEVLQTENRMLEQNILHPQEVAISWELAEKKYADKYMLVANLSKDGEGELQGDILKLFELEEYQACKTAASLNPSYRVWTGLSIKSQGLGAIGYYI